MCAQFASTMSTLLAAGVPMISALDSTSNVLDNATMFKALQEQLPKLEEAKPWHPACTTARFCRRC